MTIHLFVVSCNSKNSIDFNDKGIYGAFFNDKYQRIFAGNGKGELYILDYNLNVLSKKQLAHGPVATCISSPDNEYMINTSGDGTLYIWKVSSDSIALHYKNKIHNTASMTCLFSPKMNYVVSTGHDSTVVVLEWETKKELYRLKSNFGTVRFAWFSYDENYLLWADDKGYFYKTDLEFGTTQIRLIDNTAINCMVSNTDNTEIVASGENGYVYVLDFKSLDIKEQFKAHKGSAFVAELYDCERRKIATSGYDGYLTFWERRNKQYELETKIKAHNGPCCTLIYNDDCTKLLSGGQDGYLKIWDTKSKKILIDKYLYN